MKIYLDNNATTQIDPAVVDAMITELAAPPRNPSSIHHFGQEGKKVLSNCRAETASFLGVRSSEIFFTSGGTEGMNLLIRGFLDNPHSHIIAAPIDHACVYNTMKDLEEKGAEVTYLPINTFGAPKPSDLQKALRPQTKLIVLTAANSETGVKIDLEKIAEVARSSQIPLVIDGVSLLGKEPFSIPDGVSGMAFSAHKFHGPKGVGFIYLKKGFKLSPTMTGGGQERQLRSGTENLPGIVGMTQALKITDEAKNQATLKTLREHFESKLLEKLPDIEVNGEGPRLPNTSNIFFPGVEGEALLIALDMHKVAASHASACASGALEPSRVLLNMGYTRERAASSLRFSFSRFNTPDEIDKAVDIIATLVTKMRAAYSIS